MWQTSINIIFPILQCILDKKKKTSSNFAIVAKLRIEAALHYKTRYHFSIEMFINNMKIKYYLFVLFAIAYIYCKYIIKGVFHMLLNLKLK